MRKKKEEKKKKERERKEKKEKKERDKRRLAHAVAAAYTRRPTTSFSCGGTLGPTADFFAGVLVVDFVADDARLDFDTLAGESVKPGVDFRSRATVPSGACQRRKGRG